MLKIKEFSVLSKIGVRMLRHYDNIGLLHPAYVDKNTHYRYYDEEQLLTANKIQALKSMGISLKEITNLLAEYDNIRYLERYVEKLLVKRQKELEDLQESITYIKSALNNLKNNLTYACEITLKEIPQHKAVSLRKKIHSYKEEEQLFQTLFHEIAKQQIQLSNPPYNAAIYHDKEFKNTDIDIEVQCNVIAHYSDLRNIIFKNEKSKLIISVVIQDMFHYMPELNITVANWLKDNGYRFSGSMYNVYHIAPRKDTSSQNCLVEVCFPVQKVKD